MTSDAGSGQGRTISQFMWGYQHLFCSSVETSLSMALEEIGFDGEPAALLVGFQVAGEHQHAICIEPEDGAFGHIDLSGVVRDAEERFAKSPEHQFRHSHPQAQRDHMRALADSCRRHALASALAGTNPGQGRSFFCGSSVRIGDYEVNPVLSIDSSALSFVPQIKRTRVDRIDVCQSLVHAVLREVNMRAARALCIPDAGKGLMALGAEPSEIVRSATTLVLYSAFVCAGQWMAHGHESYFNAVSALPYEKRWGSGKLVLAKSDHPSVDVVMKLRRPVDLRETYTVRKLVEASGAADLLSDGGTVYGFGVVEEESYDPETESIFVVDIKERGIWELSHAGRPILTVRDGQGYLPRRPLNTALFRDVVSRLIPDPDLRTLELLAEAVADDNEHGAMLIVSSDAAGEAKRLAPQALEVETVAISPGMLVQLTGMDGGVLVDAKGRCHAVGVILDGMAQGVGDPSRGSRFNNAIRYLGSNPPAAVVVVYSADGNIDILPKLMPRMEKERVKVAVDAYLAQAGLVRPNFRDISKLWDRVKSFRFYLSEEQCVELNAARLKIDELRGPNSIRIVERDLMPDPRMNDSYWM